MAVSRVNDLIGVRKLEHTIVHVLYYGYFYMSNDKLKYVDPVLTEKQSNKNISTVFEIEVE